MHVSARGQFDHSKESYLFGSDTEGNPGYHVITPFHAINGMTFLVDRGYVTAGKRDPATRPEGQVRGEQTVVGLLRTEESAGLFTPPPDLAHRIWYVRDAQAIARADGLRLHDDAGIIDADATPTPGGWPKGGQTIIDIPNNHLSYALTWFGLALVLVGIYVSYHIAEGRLGIRS
jgi:surfeit locus 1 family protein